MRTWHVLLTDWYWEDVKIGTNQKLAVAKQEALATGQKRSSVDIDIVELDEEREREREIK